MDIDARTTHGADTGDEHPASVLREASAQSDPALHERPDDPTPSPFISLGTIGTTDGRVQAK